MERIFAMITEKDVVLPIYVTGIGFEEYQDHVIRKGGFPNYHLAICEAGMGKLFIDGKEYVIEKGMAFFFCPDIPHEYYPVKEPWSIRWIIFMGTGVDILLNAINFDQVEVFKITLHDEITFCYNKLYKTILAKRANNILEASAIFYPFLANINNLIEQKNTENVSLGAEKLNSIIDYIKGNFQKDITLESLAAQVNISTSYLCRIFKQVYGMSPFSYIKRYRINVAKELLINYSEKGIKNIAIECGYNNCSYFGATFKELEGCSPNQFRKLYSKQ